MAQLGAQQTFPAGAQTFAPAGGFVFPTRGQVIPQQQQQQAGLAGGFQAPLQQQQPLQLNQQQMQNLTQIRVQQAPVYQTALQYLDAADHKNPDSPFAWTRKRGKDGVHAKGNKFSFTNALLVPKPNPKGKGNARGAANSALSSFPTSIWLAPGGESIYAIAWIDPVVYAKTFGFPDVDAVAKAYPDGYPVFIYGTYENIIMALRLANLFPATATPEQVSDVLRPALIIKGSLEKPREQGARLVITHADEVKARNPVGFASLEKMIDRIGLPKEIKAARSWSAEQLGSVLLLAANIKNTVVLSENGDQLINYGDKLPRPVKNVFTNKLLALEKAFGDDEIALNNHTIDISDYADTFKISSNKERTKKNERSPAQPIRFFLIHRGADGRERYYTPGFVVSDNAKSLELLLNEIASVNQRGVVPYGFYVAGEKNLATQVPGNVLLESLRRDLHVVKETAIRNQAPAAGRIINYAVNSTRQS